MKKNLRIIFWITGFTILIVFGTRYYRYKTIPPEMSFSGTTLITVDDSVKITINDFKGKVVVVSCFQTWCRDCAAETPVLNQLAKNLNDDRFKIIYITDERNKKLESFRSKMASDKILFTWSPSSLASLGINVYPTTFLLNKKGEVVKAKLEGYDWLKEEAMIRKLMNE